MYKFLTFFSFILVQSCCIGKFSNERLIGTFLHVLFNSYLSLLIHSSIKSVVQSFLPSYLNSCLPVYTFSSSRLDIYHFCVKGNVAVSSSLTKFVHNDKERKFRVQVTRNLKNLFQKFFFQPGKRRIMICNRVNIYAC